MERTPIVSIITPSFNHEEFICETLDSILSQEGEFYIDLIIVDGASKDSTVDKIKGMADKILTGIVKLEIEELKFYQTPNIKNKGVSFRWKSEKDSGQADAINKGFSQAKGDIICWLNSDDTYASTKTLEFVTTFFKNNPDENFVYGKGYTLNRQGKIVGEESYVVNSTEENINEIDYILQPASFWRKKIYDEFGGLDSKYHFVLDWDYWVRIGRKYKLNYLDNFLACNRIYAETKTSSGSYRRYIEIIKFLNENNSLTEKSISSYIVQPEIYKEFCSLDIVTRYIFILSHKIRKDGFKAALEKIFEKAFRVVKRKLFK